MKTVSPAILVNATLCLCFSSMALAAPNVTQTVNEAIEPLLKEQDIPGMAVAVLVHGKPYRVSSGALDAEAYGVKSTSEDMLTWMQANMNPDRITDRLVQKGIHIAQTRYYRTDALYQGLGWEMLDWPGQAIR